MEAFPVAAGGWDDEAAGVPPAADADALAGGWDDDAAPVPAAAGTAAPFF